MDLIEMVDDYFETIRSRGKIYGEDYSVPHTLEEGHVT